MIFSKNKKKSTEKKEEKIYQFSKKQLVDDHYNCVLIASASERICQEILIIRNAISFAESNGEVIDSAMKGCLDTIYEKAEQSRNIAKWMIEDLNSELRG